MTDDFGPADLLTIPGFLRRKPGDKSTTKKLFDRGMVEERPTYPVEKATTLGGKWKVYRVHITYPMRGIPTGWRVLNVLVGSKWVRFIKPAHTKGTRITKKVWETMEKEEIT